MSNYRGFGGDEMPDPRKLLDPIRKNLRLVLTLAFFLLLGLGAISSFFQVEPEEEAVVLRFGEPLPQRFQPGLHFKIPWVDQVFKVPVERQHRLEFGFRSSPGKVTTSKETGFDRESLMLTGDLMLVQVRWSVVYKIEDPGTWLFDLKDREDTIRDISRAVMRQIVGDYSLEEVLTIKQGDIAAKAAEETQFALRDKVPTGVRITEVKIKSTDVPLAARKAFDDLNRTVANVKARLAEAKAEKKEVLGDERKARERAIGRAEKRLRQTIANATGEALAFESKLTEYDIAPEITRQWMYLQSMTHVFRSLEEKIIVDESSGNNTVKFLPLKDLMKGANAAGLGKSKVSKGQKAGGVR